MNWERSGRKSRENSVPMVNLKLRGRKGVIQLTLRRLSLLYLEFVSVRQCEIVANLMEKRPTKISNTHLVKKFSDFCGTKRFVTIFARALQ